MQQHPVTCVIVQPISSTGIDYLKRNGVTVVHASAPDMDTVAAEMGNAQAVITRDAGFSRAAIDAAPQLRVIGNHGTGVDPVDVEYASSLGIPVVHTPGSNAVGVAEHAIALMLSLGRKLSSADEAVRRGDFDFKYRTPMRELSGKNVGIVGFGKIGKLTARMLSWGFKANVLVYQRSTDTTELKAEKFTPCGSLEELIRRSDIVSLHLPLTEDTRGMISEKELALFHRDSMLINTARGDLVDEQALVAALKAGRIAGAGLDVFHSEAMNPDHPLLECENTVLSPHIGGSTEEALERTALDVCRQVVEVIHGTRPKHMVNPAVWRRRKGGPREPRRK